MPRSTYIYVVIDQEGSVAAAFTVKHELVTWIGRHPDVAVDTVLRVGDGGGKVTHLDVSEF